MPQNSGLTVRQHARKNFDLAVEFAIADRHQEQVRFSAMSNAKDQHATRGRAMDISTGGMGWMCEHYIPRMCQGTVRVFDPNPMGHGPDGSPIYEVAFEHRAIVRRVTMMNHDPKYSVGLAFVEAGPDVAQRVERLRDLVNKRDEQQNSGEGDE